MMWLKLATMQEAENHGSLLKRDFFNGRVTYFFFLNLNCDMGAVTRLGRGGEE